MKEEDPVLGEKRTVEKREIVKGGEESEKGGFTIISVLLVRAGKVGCSFFLFLFFVA